MNRRFALAIVFAFVASLPLPPGALASAAGLLEIRVTDHKPAIDQFRSLDVTLESVALHQQGKGRRQGWVEIASQSRPIDIVPLKDGLFQSLAQQAVPEGRYDAVRVRFTKAAGLLKTGEEPVMSAPQAIVAMTIVIKGRANPPLVLDLYAEDQTEHDPPLYVVKIKEVRRGK